MRPAFPKGRFGTLGVFKKLRPRQHLLRILFTQNGYREAALSAVFSTRNSHERLGRVWAMLAQTIVF